MQNLEEHQDLLIHSEMHHCKPVSVLLNPFQLFVLVLRMSKFSLREHQTPPLQLFTLETRVFYERNQPSPC